MPSPSRSARFLGFSAVLMGLMAGLVPQARGQELIVPRTKDRKFPQGVWCPLPLDLAFTANGAEATIRFSTNVYYQDSNNNNELSWSEQFLDNVCVSPEDVYQAHLNPRVLDTPSYDCYFGETIEQRFHFQNAGGTLLKELFDTNPVGRWDLDHGAYWSDSATAANDPGVEEDFDPLGCLGLGRDQTPRSPTDSAYTSVTVTGLTQDQNYVLTGWWYVRRMDLNDLFLTTRIYGIDGPTPIARKTWGAVKRQYR